MYTMYNVYPTIRTNFDGILFYFIFLGMQLQNEKKPLTIVA